MKKDILKALKKDGASRLRDTLLTKTGLDFENYRNPEVLGKIADILLFPIYAAKTIALPLILLLLGTLVTCIIFIVLDKSYFGIFLFFLLGIIFSIPNGILLGALNFIRQLGHDIRSIISLSLQQAQAIISDIEDVKNKAVNKEFEFPKISEVIAGVVYIIILPSLMEVIAKRIPRFGRIITAIISKVVDSVAEKMIGISEHSEKIANRKEEEQTEQTASGYYKKGITVLKKVDEKASLLTGATIKVLSFPFLIGWLPVLGISLLILYFTSLAL